MRLQHGDGAAPFERGFEQGFDFIVGLALVKTHGKADIKLAHDPARHVADGDH
ncbi:hypothetical protein D3C86_2268810 [compost metagenome]